MLADLHFTRPYWLLAIAPAIVLALLFYRYNKHNSPWLRLIASHLQPILLGSQNIQKKQPLAVPVLLLGWVIGSLALAGPSWQKVPQPAFALKRASVLILDMSMSMRATDMTPDRFSQQRFKALDFTEDLKEGELALISFAGDAFVISPLTPDHNNVRLLIPDLNPEIMPSQGSNVLAALQQAEQLLLQAGYPVGDIYLFTDGFDERTYLPLMDKINNWPHRLSILAFGTAEGAAVKMINGELLKNSQGAVVLPRVPLSQLATLASRSGGQFVSARTDDQDIQQLLSQAALSMQDKTDPLHQIKGDQWRDNAVYLVWLLLPLALWLGKRTPLIMLAPLFFMPTAEAFSWQDLWKSQQQQAQQHYQQQQFAEAQQKFSDPLWQGNAAYRNGDYAQAEQAFRQVATSTNNAESWHNLGNALAQQQRYQEALEAYHQALEQQPSQADSKHNAELMEKLLQQQDQQQQNQQQNGDSSDQQQNGQQQNNQEQQQAGNDGEPSAQNEQSDSEQHADNQQQSADSNNQPDEQQPEQQPLPSQPEPTPQQQAEELSQQAVQEAWPNATPEQQQELNNLLRKVQDDPSLLLRRKMELEYQKRRQQTSPRGAEQEW